MDDLIEKFGTRWRVKPDFYDLFQEYFSEGALSEWALDGDDLERYKKRYKKYLIGIDSEISNFCKRLGGRKYAELPKPVLEPFEEYIIKSRDLLRENLGGVKQKARRIAKLKGGKDKISAQEEIMKDIIAPLAFTFEKQNHVLRFLFNMTTSGWESYIVLLAEKNKKGTNIQMNELSTVRQEILDLMFSKELYWGPSSLADAKALGREPFIPMELHNHTKDAIRKMINRAWEKFVNTDPYSMNIRREIFDPPTPLFQK